MSNIYIVLLAILVACYLYKQSTQQPVIKENLKNISSPSAPITVVLQRYSRYDPYYFPHPVDQCYLGVHHDGVPIRARGCENWQSKKFTLIPADSRHYYIQAVGSGAYLYLSKNMKPLTRTHLVGASLINRSKWEITVNPLGHITIWNPATRRFLALSCVDDNVYSRLDYHNDCLFKAIVDNK